MIKGLVIITLLKPQMFNLVPKLIKQYFDNTQSKQIECFVVSLPPKYLITV